jgi:hypothetical protein
MHAACDTLGYAPKTKTPTAEITTISPSLLANLMRSSRSGWGMNSSSSQSKINWIMRGSCTLNAATYSPSPKKWCPMARFAKPELCSLKSSILAIAARSNAKGMKRKYR